MLTQQARQGRVPTRDAITAFYQQQLMRSSTESRLDPQASGTPGVHQGEELRLTEEVGHGPDKPTAGPAGPGPGPAPGPAPGLKPEPGLELGPGGPHETEAAEEHAGAEPAVELQGPGCPECSASRTSQRERPRLFRMKRVQSSSSFSSSSDEDRRCRLVRQRLVMFLSSGQKNQHLVLSSPAPRPLPPQSSPHPTAWLWVWTCRIQIARTRGRD